MGKIRSLLSGLKRLKAHWRLWSLRLVAQARRVRALEPRDPRRALAEAEALEVTVWASVHTLSHQIETCRAAAATPEETAELRYLRGFAGALMALAMYVRGLCDRLRAALRGLGRERTANLLRTNAAYARRAGSHLRADIPFLDSG